MGERGTLFDSLLVTFNVSYSTRILTLVFPWGRFGRRWREGMQQVCEIDAELLVVRLLHGILAYKYVNGLCISHSGCSHQ